MTKPSHRIGLYGLAALLVACALARAESYTLPQVIDLALSSSREIKAIEEEMVKTDAQIMEAKGGALPTISLSANYGYQFKQASFLGGDGFGSDMGAANPGGLMENMESGADSLLAQTIEQLTQGLDFDPDAFQTPKNSLALGISLEQAIFAQGKVSVGLKIARTYKRTLNCKYVAQRQKTVAEVTNLFNGCLLARENTATAQEAVALAQQSYELAVTRTSLGDGNALDTLNARFNLETAKLNLRKYQERPRQFRRRCDRR